MVEQIKCFKFNILKYQCYSYPSASSPASDEFFLQTPSMHCEISSATARETLTWTITGWCSVHLYVTNLFMVMVRFIFIGIGNCTYNTNTFYPQHLETFKLYERLYSYPIQYIILILSTPNISKLSSNMEDYTVNKYNT